MRQRLALSIGEAAEALGASRASIWRWIKSGQLPATRIGGRVLVPVEALRRRLEDSDHRGQPGERDGDADREIRDINNLEER